MKYYSHLLNRAISYDKNLITPQEIQEIIDYIFEFQTAKFRIHNPDVFIWNEYTYNYVYYGKIEFIDKKSIYYFKMCRKIYIMFINGEMGEK